eukprot:TRINITY_DN4283_c2_g1_i1.p1 TRINITY_DN4283_c2_g1~~TRINITY_DN4283_c2_g1_i1.p1  ORF type:complete len:114 (+),score=13.06 TRINITY_DN4283_c2_g1_i1:417-758(+)
MNNSLYGVTAKKPLLLSVTAIEGGVNCSKSIFLKQELDQKEKEKRNIRKKGYPPPVPFQRIRLFESFYFVNRRDKQKGPPTEVLKTDFFFFFWDTILFFSFLNFSFGDAVLLL